MAGLKIGELRDRVLIKAKTTTLNNERLATTVFDSGTSVWANMAPVGGEVSQQRYGVSESGITMRMKTHKLPIVAIGNKVVFDGVEYEIRHVAKYPDAYTALLRAL